jgi:ribosomal protein S18 acetylase RimI-like enzyme
VITIRPAVAADLAAVAALAALHSGSQRPSWRARLHDDLSTAGRCVLVAADDRPAGHAGDSGAGDDRLGDGQMGDGQIVGYGQAGDGQTGHGQVVGYGRVRHFEPGPQAPPDVAPGGYYLSGIVVHPDWRHQRVGERLTQARMAWTSAFAPEVWYFTNAANQASLRLHHRLGFREVTRDFTFPGVTFTGGTGVLCRASIGAAERGRSS